MESNPGASLRAHGVRPLGLPRPLEVRTNVRGEPEEITFEGGDRSQGSRSGGQHGQHVVEHIDEVWRVGEAWWREAPIQRTYFRVLIDGGRPLTLFRDDSGFLDGLPENGTNEGSPAWYEQRY